MPQFARPDADTYRGAYEDQSGGTSNLYDTLDETAPSDADYVRSPLRPANEPYVMHLSPVQDPGRGPVVLNFRYRKDQAGGGRIDYIIELSEGYVNESSLGTLIVRLTFENIPATWTDGSWTLTTGEEDSITNYSNLFLR